jgi:hypothetical protein
MMWSSSSALAMAMGATLCCSSQHGAAPSDADTLQTAQPLRSCPSKQLVDQVRQVLSVMALDTDKRWFARRISGIIC